MNKIDMGIIHDSKDVHAVQTGLHFGHFGVCLYAREYWKYRSYQFGLSIDIVNSFDRYFDIEIKILCFSIVLRFISIKRKKNKFENHIFVT